MTKIKKKRILITAEMSISYYCTLHWNNLCSIPPHTNSTLYKERRLFFRRNITEFMFSHAKQNMHKLNEEGKNGEKTAYLAE